MKKLILMMGICCFSFGGLADTKTEILQNKVDRMEAELSLIQRKLYQQPIQSVPSAQTTPSNIDELYSQIDAQNQLIQTLTEKVERLEFELSTLGNKVERVNQDMDFRLNELNMQKSTEQKEKTISTKTGDKQAYEVAYNELKKGNYEVAEQAFLKFMAEFPNSNLIGNANYWLGESYYVRGQYAEAAGLFADGFTKYKDNTKAPDNMLKLGLTMKALNKKAEACTAFKGLADEFPKANESLKKRANEEAKALKC